MMYRKIEVDKFVVIVKAEKNIRQLEPIAKFMLPNCKMENKEFNFFSKTDGLSRDLQMPEAIIGKLNKAHEDHENYGVKPTAVLKVIEETIKNIEAILARKSSGKYFFLHHNRRTDSDQNWFYLTNERLFFDNIGKINDEIKMISEFIKFIDESNLFYTDIIEDDIQNTGSHSRPAKTYQTLETITPVDFQSTSGKTQHFEIHSLAIPFRNLHNDLEVRFTRTIDTLISEGFAKPLPENGDVFNEITKDWLSVEDAPMARKVAYRAMDSEDAIVYFGSVDSLGSIDFEGLKEVVTFVLEVGPKKVVVGAFSYASSIVLIRITKPLADGFGEIIKATCKRIASLMEPEKYNPPEVKNEHSRIDKPD